MPTKRYRVSFIVAVTLLCVIDDAVQASAQAAVKSEKTRIVITSDAEADDECFLMRCLLYANELDVEGIISTSSQYHAHDHNWAGDDWHVKYMDAYAKVYPNLIRHDRSYPTPDYFQSRTFLGNVETEGDMKESTPGSQHKLSTCYWTNRTTVQSGSWHGVV